MSIVPFATPNEGAVLVAGAGGGYDFLCGLPIIIELEKRGREVLIANYSFSNLAAIKKAKCIDANAVARRVANLLNFDDKLI